MTDVQDKILQNSTASYWIRYFFSLISTYPQDETGEMILSLEFQKIRYVFDHKEKKCFSPIAFPICHPMGYFQSWRGYQEEAELRAAEQGYGTNRAEMVVPDFLELFRERATAPFFVFQVCVCVCVRMSPDNTMGFTVKV